MIIASIFRYIWLNDKGYQRSVIMGPKQLGRLAFYAGGEFLQMPDSRKKVIQSIRESGVKIVVIDSYTIEQDCPGFLANRPLTGLFPLDGAKGKVEKCPIQIYVAQ